MFAGRSEAAQSGRRDADVSGMTLRRLSPQRAEAAREPRGALSPPFGERPGAPLAPPDTATALLVLAVVAVPITWGTVLWSAPGGDHDFNRRLTVQLFDFALLAAACPTIARWAAAPGAAFGQLAGRARRGDPLTVGGAALAVLGLVALAAHPSPRGGELAVRLVLGAVTVHGILTASPSWFAAVRVATAAMASLQGVLAIVQSANGAPLGLRWLEFEGPLYPFGSSFAGRGGLTHPYHLAFVVEVGIVAVLVSLRRTARPFPWLVALATCSGGLGVTYSRAAAIGLAGAVLALLWPARTDDAPSGLRRLRLHAALALVAGAAATGLLLGNGWSTRTSSSTDVAAADSGRAERAREALDLIGDAPVTGVGPGQYTIALAERGDPAPLPAHNFTLHVAAEAGVVAGVAVTIVGLLLARRYLVSTREAAAGFVLVVPYFVFDAYPYVFPVGLFLTAVWLGLLERARSS
jgi:hypothetical protein